MALSTTGGGLYFDSTIDDSQFGAAINRMNNEINGLSNNVKKQGSDLENFANRAAKAATAFFSLQAAEGFIEKMIQVRGEFQQLEVALTTMLGSKEASNKLMGQMVQLAATTPFTLTEVAKSGKQLLAYGFAADTITDTLTKLGSVAAGVSAPIGDIAYLFGTLKTQGRAFTKDIREFSGRGIPIIAELAKVLKTSEANVSTLVEAGKVGFPEVEKAFNNLTSSGGMFYNLMKEQSKTLTGQLSNLSDAWDNMLNSLGKSQEGIFSSGIAAVTELVQNYDKVLSIITVLTAGYGVYRAALLATAAVDKIGLTNAGNMVVALNAESVARIAKAGAEAEEMRVEVSNLAVKKAAAIHSYQNAQATLAESEAKLANLSTGALTAAQERESLARKAAIAASSAFYTAKLELETAAKGGATAAELSSMRAEVVSLNVKRETALQTAINAEANLKNVESKTLASAQEKVIAAQEQAAIARKAAIAAGAEFNTAKTELETTAKIANSAATVELTAVESLQAANKRILIALQQAYNAVLAATPAAAFAVVLTALGVAIYALTQTTSAAVVATRALNDIQAEIAGKIAEQRLAVTDYVKIIKDANSTENERTTALKKLTDLSPKILGALNAQNISTRQGSDAIKEYLKWLDAKLQGEAAYVIKSDAVRRIAERNIKASAEGEEKTKGLDWTKRLGYSLRNFITGNSKLSSADESQQIVDELNKHDQAIINAVDKKYGAALKQRALDGVTRTDATIPDVKNKAYYDAIIKKNTEDLEALDSGAKDFEARSKPLIAKINAARKALLAFDSTGKQAKTDAKADNLENSALKRQAEMLQKIYELNEKYNNKSLTDDEQKLADIRAEFKSLQTDIDQYNKDPKNKKVNPNLKPALEKALDNQEYENETKRLAAQLDKQKTLYADFEAYKVLFGEDKAKQRFGEELTSTDQFIADLEARRAKLLETDPLNMSGIQKDRLKLYDDSINGLVEAQKKGYDQLLQDNLSYLEQRKVTTDNYNAEIARLEGNPVAQAEATARYKDQIQTLDDTNVQKLGSYKRLFDGVDRLSDDNAKKVVNDAQVMLDQLVKNGTISAELAKQIKDKLKDTNDSIEQRLPANLNALANELRNLSSAVSGIDAGFSALLSTVSDVVKGVADIKTGLKDYKEAGKKDDTLGQITAGLGVLSAGVGIAKSVIGGVVGFFKSAKESAKKAAAELQTFQDNTVKGEIAYNQLLRERERTLKTISELSLSELRTQEALLKTQTSAAQADYNRLLGLINASGQQITGTHIEKKGGFLGIGKKSTTVQDTAGVAGLTYDQLEALFTQGKLTDSTKAWFSELQKAKSELDAIGVSGDDVLDAINQAATGTTASSIADAIISGFKEGKRSAADFADSFKDLMSDAALSVFKSNFLNKAIDGFYKQFAAASENGLSEDDIKTLRDAYSKIITDGAAQLADFDKIIGTDKNESATKTGVSGAIVGEAITEGTANRGLGIWISQYDEIKRQGIITQNYFSMSANSFKNIEAYTLRTANNTDGLISKLNQIIENLGGDPGDDLGQDLRNGGVRAA